MKNGCAKPILRYKWMKMFCVDNSFSAAGKPTLERRANHQQAADTASVACRGKQMTTA
jgi:hypothetical protein